jgi:hypothetical protein
MSKARPRTPSKLSDLTRKEWIELLEQAALGVEDSYIAKRYLLDEIAQIDIAEELGDQVGICYSRSTMSRRLPAIIGKVERTANKIGIR